MGSKAGVQFQNKTLCLLSIRSALQDIGNVEAQLFPDQSLRRILRLGNVFFLPQLACCRILTSLVGLIGALTKVQVYDLLSSIVET